MERRPNQQTPKNDLTGLPVVVPDVDEVEYDWVSHHESEGHDNPVLVSNDDEFEAVPRVHEYPDVQEQVLVPVFLGEDARVYANSPDSSKPILVAADIRNLFQRGHHVYIESPEEWQAAAPASRNNDVIEQDGNVYVSCITSPFYEEVHIKNLNGGEDIKVADSVEELFRKYTLYVEMNKDTGFDKLTFGKGGSRNKFRKTTSRTKNARRTKHARRI